MAQGQHGTHDLVLGCGCKLFSLPGAPWAGGGSGKLEAELLSVKVLKAPVDGPSSQSYGYSQGLSWLLEKVLLLCATRRRGETQKPSRPDDVGWLL